MTTGRTTFDAIYAGRTPLGERAPWDIGAPQPVIDDLERSGRLRGDILDAGCGTGENALLLSGRGYRVTAFDISAVAIESARTKATERGLPTRFEVVDAGELDRQDGFHGRFDTVVDCGLFDSCGRTLRARYAAALRRTCRAGATAFLLELGFEAASVMRERFRAVGLPEPLVERMPRLRPDDVTAAFRAGWRVDDIGAATMRARLPGDDEPIDLPALFAVITAT